MKDNSLSAKSSEVDQSAIADEPANENVSDSRRKALSKLAYSSPVIVGLLLSKNVAAQSSPNCGPAGGTFSPPCPP